MKKNIKTPPPGRSSSSGGNRRPLYWIGLVCFSSLWMFALGIWVGRGTAPFSMDIKALQNELTEITRMIQEKEEKDLAEYADRVEIQTDLEFYQSLKTEDKSPSRKSEKKDPSVQTVDPPVKKSLAVATKSQMIHKKSAPEPEAEPEPEPESPGEVSYQWTIQVSSVKDSRTADAMVADLKKMEIPAYKVMAQTEELGVFYRVRVGPYKDKTRADRHLSVLKENNYDALMIAR
jgi:cell division septation protein DedD